MGWGAALDAVPPVWGALLGFVPATRSCLPAVPWAYLLQKNLRRSISVAGAMGGWRPSREGYVVAFVIHTSLDLKTRHGRRVEAGDRAHVHHAEGLEKSKERAYRPEPERHVWQLAAQRWWRKRNSGRAEGDYNNPYDNIDTRPGTNDKQRDAGRAVLAALQRRLGIDSVGKRIANGRGQSAVLGYRLIDSFVAGKPNQLVGQKIGSVDDLVAFA